MDHEPISGVHIIGADHLCVAQRRVIGWVRVRFTMDDKVLAQWLVVDRGDLEAL